MSAKHSSAVNFEVDSRRSFSSNRKAVECMVLVRPQPLQLAQPEIVGYLAPTFRHGGTSSNTV
jgi:hypothetical protein